MFFSVKLNPLMVIYGVLLFFVLSFTTLTPLHAQSQAGVSISPALIEETLLPGTQKEYIVTIRNLNPIEQTFYLYPRDIVDVRDGGTPVFAEPNQEKAGMELAQWVALPVTQVTLAPNETQQIPFTLSVPADATPGGHFGSIFISVDPPEIQTIGASVGYQVANIISIRIAGDAVEGANIRQFSTRRFFQGSKNVDFVARIENTGTVLVRPTGPVEIYNMLGRKIDTVIFNESQAAIFPQKVREYTFNWTGEGSGFGRYEAVLSAVYGDEGSKRTISSTVSFWILPLNIILPSLATLAVILLIAFVLVRSYVRRAVAQLAQGQSRVVRRQKKSTTSGLLLLLVVMLLVTALFLLILLVLFA